jgi:EAL domain-containing protein (putative c-di-GMP-specific phosphodiesterase class I)/CheY-like chemotaxis protein
MLLHYQPLVDLGDGQLSGFEALLRWNHPDRGPISPAEFIPVAEASGVIVPIGKWVLNEACRQVTAWQREMPSLPPLSMSVNVSARQLADPHLVEDVAGALSNNSLDPSLLTLEITETMIMADEDAIFERLHQLKALGVRIAVDDFGTGYSSLGHLERFPIDELKIDCSFVAGLHSGGRDSGVAAGVIRLARSLHIEAVAEGIERVDQLTELRRLHCTRGQGYYLSRPQDPATVESILRHGSDYVMPISSTIVLVVDDNEEVRRSTSRILSQAGYEVLEAGTGLEALRMAGETRLDAAILDIELPDMDGFELCRRLAEMSHGDLPILHLSGAAVAIEDRVRGLDTGAQAYITKPVAPRELLAVLGALLRSRGSSSLTG